MNVDWNVWQRPEVAGKAVPVGSAGPANCLGRNGQAYFVGGQLDEDFAAPPFGVSVAALNLSLALGDRQQ